MALLNSKPRSATVRTTEPVRVLVLERDDFNKIITEAPQVALKVLEVMSTRIRNVDEQISELSDQAMRDALTGLLNRRAFHERLLEETNRARRYGDRFSLILLDVDRFKTINDTEGHQAGDQVLRAVAQALEENTRASDLSGRFGGDEFLTLLPGANVRGALAFAERVKESTTTRFSELGLPVTISIGVAVSNSSTKNEDDLLQAADIALYSAKREGGDQAVIAGPWPMKEARLDGSAQAEGSLAS
jgi:diguanylate cyclase (GGDEF)-like protein